MLVWLGSNLCLGNAGLHSSCIAGLRWGWAEWLARWMDLFTTAIELPTVSHNTGWQSLSLSDQKSSSARRGPAYSSHVELVGTNRQTGVEYIIVEEWTDGC